MIANAEIGVEDKYARREGQEYFARARQEFEALIGWVAEVDGTLSEVEMGLDVKGRQVMREVLQGYMDLRAASEEEHEEVVGADGVGRRHRRRGQKRTVGTIFGEVEARRVRYETKEASEGSLSPLDGELNLAKRKYSHQATKRVAEWATMVSFERVAEIFEQTSGLAIPKRQIEQLVQEAAEDFEEFYAQRSVEAIWQGLKDESVTVLTTDGKGVSVYPEDLREETRKKTEKEEGRGLYFRKRMAQVACVYEVERYRRTADSVVRGLMGGGKGGGGGGGEQEGKRPKPEHKRVWASIVEAPQAVIRRMFDEAERRDPGRRTRWVAVVDGAMPQLDAVKEEARARGVELEIICDIVHALEYLWDAARVLVDESKQAEWVRQRLLRLLQGEVSQVAAGMRRAKTMCGRRLSKKQRSVVDRSADYLLRHKEYMRYHDYLAEGYPISSGVIEGTVRHLVNDRLGITGAHWRLVSAEAVLQLRALKCSGDFDEYWAFHERREKYRNHESKYAGGKLPPVTTLRPGEVRRPFLRLIPGGRSSDQKSRTPFDSGNRS
jgi:hypothetical protein